MSIRFKIVLVVLPLLIVPLISTAVSSWLLASGAVTRLAGEFLTFKAEGLENYANSQWNLLVENDVADNPEMEEAARAAVAAWAATILRSETEAVLAIDEKGSIAFIRGPLSISDTEAQEAIKKLGASEETRQFASFTLGDEERVAAATRFAPFGWYLLVTESKAVFYGPIQEIAFRAVLILLIAVSAAFVLLLLSVRAITRPAEHMVTVIKRIMEENDLSQRVPVVYDDEIGRISWNFNRMLEALDEAYSQIKHFAFDAVVAQKRETKIRNIFQLYVPKDVIEQVFVNPEKMLTGNNRLVSVLFSDIRNFTGISENMAPDKLVESLNRYFGGMVDIIMNHDGVVDKFIGDAIMAIYGAPISHGNDALSSILSAIEMCESLGKFNERQRVLHSPEFAIGVGIAHGIVTVGNIGCEKKMNYTVIGDMVNLASRLESLTKVYKVPILVSDGAREAAGDSLQFRLIDKVAVVGKQEASGIYLPRRTLNKTEEAIFPIHKRALDMYFKRQFSAAKKEFQSILAIDATDECALRFSERCDIFIQHAPPEDWDGAEVMHQK